VALNVRKQATEASDGTFVVRTEGLRSLRHAELEIAGVPRSAVEAAAKLIDYVVSSIVEAEGSELKAGENAGFPLTIQGHDDVEALFVAVRAIEAEPPAGGIVARMLGTAKGVLRLADLFDRSSDVPLTAVATVMLYRADCRVVTGDVPGAVAELRAAIEMMPGAASAERMPALDTGDARFNWQNHLSYLRLAELLDDEKERASVLGEAYARFEWLAMDELGATVGELSSLTGEELLAVARHVLQTNLARPMITPGPHEGLRIVGCPIWTHSGGGKSVREASLIPTAFVDYYFGDAMKRDENARALPEIAAACVSRWRAEPWRVLEMTRRARSLYLCPNAPILEAAAARHPAHTTLSAVLAEASRHLHAGASLDEVRAAFDTGELSEDLAGKLSALDAWEADQERRAIECTGGRMADA
jgi:hypothetical protein